jgi:hypothetical protein
MGFGIGVLVTLVPLYQSEVSPPESRGLMVGLHGGQQQWYPHQRHCSWSNIHSLDWILICIDWLCDLRYVATNKLECFLHLNMIPRMLLRTIWTIPMEVSVSSTTHSNNSIVDRIHLASVFPSMVTVPRSV